MDITAVDSIVDNIVNIIVDISHESLILYFVKLRFKALCFFIKLQFS